jgi:hypothetical protein
MILVTIERVERVSFPFAVDCMSVAHRETPRDDPFAFHHRFHELVASWILAEPLTWLAHRCHDWRERVTIGSSCLDTMHAPR